MRIQSYTLTSDGTYGKEVIRGSLGAKPHVLQYLSDYILQAVQQMGPVLRSWNMNTSLSLPYQLQSGRMLLGDAAATPPNEPDYDDGGPDFGPVDMNYVPDEPNEGRRAERSRAFERYCQEREGMQFMIYVRSGSRHVAVSSGMGWCSRCGGTAATSCDTCCNTRGGPAYFCADCDSLIHRVQYCHARTCHVRVRAGFGVRWPHSVDAASSSDERGASLEALFSEAQPFKLASNYFVRPCETDAREGATYFELYNAGEYQLPTALHPNDRTCHSRLHAPCAPLVNLPRCASPAADASQSVHNLPWVRLGT